MATVNATVELNKYLEEGLMPMNSDPILFWINHPSKELREIALKVLAISATSTPSERVFSTGRNFSTKKRNRLAPGNIDKLETKKIFQYLASLIVGIAKVKILPPKNLYILVLPLKINNKLMFALCQTCASEENGKTCIHSDAEREIIGTTYTYIELQKAVEKGY